MKGAWFVRLASRLRGSLVLGIALGGIVPHVAGAEPTGSTEGQARAKVLFAEGYALAAQGDYEQACSKLEESLKLNAGLGTEYNLADCFEHLGSKARARELFLDVANRTRDAGQSERERTARVRVAVLSKAIEADEAASEVPVAPIVIAGTAPRKLSAARSCAADVSQRLTRESDVLAESSASLAGLESEAEELARIAPGDARLQQVERDLAELERQLANAWRLAGRVGAQLVRSTARPPR